MTEDVNRIFPGFYISSLASIKRDILDDHQITHVLSVMNDYKPKWPKMYKCKVVDIYDSYTVDIKKHFEDTFTFIEEGRREGAVLVHCFAGMSRSATVCIAYMMKKLGITYQDAYEILKEARDIIDPNDGFVKQLAEYEIELKRIKDGASTTTTTTEVIETISSITETRTETEQVTTTTTTIIQEEEIIEQKIASLKYCCRKCGKILFNDIDLEQHDVGSGQSSFKWGRRDITLNPLQAADPDSAEQQEQQVDQAQHSSCTSYFLAETDWISGNIAIGGNDGKILCDNPKCGEKLGSFSWSGSQCSCGNWICPSFRIPKSRVDEKKITYQYLVCFDDQNLIEINETWIEIPCFSDVVLVEIDENWIEIIS
ncbi:hypothetical protein DFA_07090 [Cavenderia fasciculata]|uniref:protein-tyrosine-phosphatase n=1 Tax=Cavenderia fasciculata TaxID=261658 RepID=F4PVG2_CACFS|nr:uncharacterized protein DFA_07090 [Cavenderia fasciculata]EGG19976.1 hypothetical protein DFA_07090 [Cavenderia fasciculata]|eukprot:XP_004366959.1 hypothetical protein DFA_07090 [Cavenderia fasciculata]